MISTSRRVKQGKTLGEVLSSLDEMAKELRALGCTVSIGTPSLELKVSPEVKSEENPDDDD